MDPFAALSFSSPSSSPRPPVPSFFAHQQLPSISDADLAQTQCLADGRIEHHQQFNYTLPVLAPAPYATDPVLLFDGGASFDLPGQFVFCFERARAWGRGKLIVRANPEDFGYELNTIIALLYDEYGFGFTALVSNLLDDIGFFLLRFKVQLESICHALTRCFTLGALRVLAPHAITKLTVSLTSRDSTDVLDIFTEPANFASLTSLSIFSINLPAHQALAMARRPIESLTLSHVQANLETIASLLQLKSTLSSLSLEGNLLVDDHALPLLSLFPHLLFLELSGTSVTGPGLLAFIRRASASQPNFKHLTAPSSVLEWIASLFTSLPPVVVLEGSFVSDPIKVDNMTKSACIANLALHVRPDQVAACWDIATRREKLKAALQSRTERLRDWFRLDHIALLRVLGVPLAAARRTRSLQTPSTHAPEALSKDMKLAWNDLVFPAIDKVKAYRCDFFGCGRDFDVKKTYLAHIATHEA
ncbi:hypothetical protein P7C70_g2451, partial [Phenoliferia sp. Uapishka_3]